MVEREIMINEHPKIGRVSQSGAFFCWTKPLRGRQLGINRKFYLSVASTPIQVSELQPFYAEKCSLTYAAMDISVLARRNKNALRRHCHFIEIINERSEQIAIWGPIITTSCG